MPTMSEVCHRFWQWPFAVAAKKQTNYNQYSKTCYCWIAQPMDTADLISQSTDGHRNAGLRCNQGLYICRFNSEISTNKRRKVDIH